MSNFHITSAGAKFGEKIPARKIIKIFGKNHEIPISDDGFASYTDVIFALQNLKNKAISEMENGSEIIVNKTTKKGGKK